MTNLGWGRPRAGDVDAWVVVTVALSCVLAVVIVAVGTYELAYAGAAMRPGVWGPRSTFESSARHLVPALWMAVLLGVSVMPRSSTSRAIRLAVVIPISHALALLVAAVAVQFLDLPDLANHTPYLEMLPVLPWFLSGLGLSLAVAWAIGGRREWAHAFVMFALAFLLLFALWLPIASAVPVRRIQYYGTYQATLRFLEAHPVSVSALAIAPPFAVAAIYTWLSIRIVRRNAIYLQLTAAITAGVLLLASIGFRFNGSRGSFAVHDNFTHLLLAAAMLAIVATATLSLSTWVASWRARQRLERDRTRRDFTISDDGADFVAGLRIAGWLRGPSMFSRPFTASDGNHEIRVPGNANIVMAVPKISSIMRAGEVIEVVSKRDRLRLGGLVANNVGDSPFRSHEITELGPDYVVAHAEPISTPAETMLLTAWRPSIAYSIILVAAALPSLVGLIVDVSK